ncbi:septum formation initiator family protein [Candidatus Kaiserbacteria bacterium]|nr:septum formation initiator family protein [Candidatus Kaiserbacteria bacterium]
MFDFYEKRKIRQWLYSWPFLILLIIMSIFLTHGVWGVYQQEVQTRVNKNQRVAHLEELEVRRNALQDEINRLNTERGIEEEIRQKFEVAKEGEGVIVIVEPPSSLEVEEEVYYGVLKRFTDMVIFWR